MCDKRFIWNPSNCDCECDNSCDTGEYLVCRKTLVDKLVEECTDNVEEVKVAKMILAEEGKNMYKCSSYMLCIVLFSIIFTINIGIGAYFVYYKYMNHVKKTDPK